MADIEKVLRELRVLSTFLVKDELVAGSILIDKAIALIERLTPKPMTTEEAEKVLLDYGYDREDMHRLHENETIYTAQGIVREKGES